MDEEMSSNASSQYGFVRDKSMPNYTPGENGGFMFY